MIEEELYNEYRKSDCKSFTDFLINKIAELKKTYRKQRNKRIDELQKENAELKSENQKWKDGAEFGYNKGRNEAKEILKGLYFIIESRIDYKNNIGIADEMWRAKQFLKESE